MMIELQRCEKKLKTNSSPILKDIRTNESVSMVTNPRSDTKNTQKTLPSGSKSNKSINVHASNNENSDSDDDDDHPLRASDMKELRKPEKPRYQNEFNQNETKFSNGDSEEGNYLTYISKNLDQSIQCLRCGMWYHIEHVGISEVQKEELN